MRSAPFVGIDVGANRLHVAALDRRGRVHDAAVFSRAQLPELAEWLPEAEVVAIDAPAALSAAPHAGDETLGTKFRRARCAEIALGRNFGYWVPWVTPAGPPMPGWMETGFAVYEALGRSRRTLLEVYPYAGFRRLANRQLAKKTTVAGLVQRVELLWAAGVQGEGLQMWSHDSLDALLGAVVAKRYAEGAAVEASCGHDDSAIWLP
jgi:predicted nuclease with RNAse H fold